MRIFRFIEHNATRATHSLDFDLHISFFLVSDGKYHMLPTGELLIINVTRTDAQRSYRCRTHHQLTQEAVVSDNIGRIQLTGE